MKIGILHTYTLTGSGSSVCVRELAQHLARRDHEVHVISSEQRPHEYALFRDAYAYWNGTSRPLFTARDQGLCYSHSLLAPIAPVAYRRRTLPHGRLFTTLSEQEIDDYIAFASSTINNICREYRLDILHANHALLMPYIASIVKAPVGIPYVVTVHGSTIEYVLQRDQRYWPYAIEGLQNADRIIGLNSNVISRILEISPDMRSNIIEIPNGTDTRAFSPVAAHERKRVIDGITSDLRPQKASCDAVRSDNNLAEKLSSISPERGPLVFYSGSLRFDKGVHCLIAAMPHILERLPDCRLIIAGDGEDRGNLEAATRALDKGNVGLFQKILHSAIVDKGSGGPEVYEYISAFLRTQNLKSYAETSRGKLGDRVIFTGYLSRLYLSQLLACATVSVVPSIVKEASPLVFMEALSCGVLPIATYHAGLGPLLDKLASDLGEIGQLCRVSHRPESMIRDLAANIVAILQRLEDASSAERVKSQCRQMVESEYSWDIVATLTEDVYYACLRKEPARDLGRGRA